MRNLNEQEPRREPNPRRSSKKFDNVARTTETEFLFSRNNFHPSFGFENKNFRDRTEKKKKFGERVKGRECEEEEEEDEVEDGALGVPGRAAGVGLEGVAVGNAEGVPPGQPQRGESVNISHKRHFWKTDPYS